MPCPGDDLYQEWYCMVGAWHHNTNVNFDYLLVIKNIKIFNNN